MNRFTIFTILLVLTVSVVTADLAVRDYFDEGEAQSAETSVLDSAFPDTEPREPHESQPPPPPEPSPPEPPQYIPPPKSSTVTQTLLLEAGFNGKIKEDHFNGKVFELLDITRFPVEAISFYKILLDAGPVVSIVEIRLQDEIRALQLYSLLQNKTKPYIDLSLNETNAYGDRSFYINHAKKPNEAFLAIKIRNMIYGIAYVKVFHPEVKKLIQSLIP